MLSKKVIEHEIIMALPSVHVIDKYIVHILVKVACTSAPFSSKIMNEYPIFSVQIIEHQVDQMHK